MLHETPAKTTVGAYVKVPNCTGLYRHSRSGTYYGVKKLRGKRKERSLRTADRKIAERRFREWIGNLEKVDTEVEKTTLKQLSDKLIAINQGKSKSTRYISLSVLEDFQQWCGVHTQIRDIRPSKIEEWLAHHHRHLRASSSNRYSGVLKQLFEIAVGDRIIAESPFVRVKMGWQKPETPTIRRIPTPDQLNAIVASIRSQRFTKHAQNTADFVEFLGLAGLGQKEASSLTWGDVNWERGCLSIWRHKTKVQFFVPIYPHLRALLEKLKDAAGRVFASTRVFKIKDAKKALAAACQRLGYHAFSQRNIRQSLIMRLWKSGVDKKLIAKWQGHQDGGQLILSTYTQVFGDDDAEYEQQQLAKIA